MSAISICIIFFFIYALPNSKIVVYYLPMPVKKFVTISNYEILPPWKVRIFKRKEF